MGGSTWWPRRELQEGGDGRCIGAEESSLGDTKFRDTQAHRGWGITDSASELRCTIDIFDGGRKKWQPVG